MEHCDSGSVLAKLSARLADAGGVAKTMVVFSQRTAVYEARAKAAYAGFQEASLGAAAAAGTIGEDLWAHEFSYWAALQSLRQLWVRDGAAYVTAPPLLLLLLLLLPFCCCCAHCYTTN